MLLSKKPIGTDAKSSLIEEPSLMHFDNDQKIMTARYNWTEVCGVFEAKGGEKYVTLGNFLSNEDTKSTRMKKDPKVKAKIIIAAYYYIDNISVTLLSDNQQCDCMADEGNDEYSTMIYQKIFPITEEMTSKEKVESQQTFFAFGKSKLSTQAKTSLDLVAAEMLANPSTKLQVMGHNNKMEDSVAVTNDYYADMDAKRVGAVINYLVAKGIDKARFIPAPKGSGSSNIHIIESDDAELKLAKNRFVSFKVR